MRSARRAELIRGFTLIEVLVALVIVTLGMAALMSSLSSAADGAAYMRDKTFAQWVALDQIALARLQTQPPSVGDKTGETELANRKWTWKQTVTNTDAPGIAQIEVSVRPADVPPPKGDKDSGWFVTVSGIRGKDVAIGTVPVTYNDITQSCEAWGQQSPSNLYNSPPPPRMSCAPGVAGRGGVNNNPNNANGSNSNSANPNGANPNGSGSNSSSQTGGSSGGSSGSPSGSPSEPQ